MGIDTIITKYWQTEPANIKRSVYYQQVGFMPEMQC